MKPANYSNSEKELSHHSAGSHDQLIIIVPLYICNTGMVNSGTVLESSLQ